MKQKQKPRDYSSKQAAKMLRWHKTQVSRWAKRLSIGRKEGKFLYFNQAEIEILKAIKKAAVAGNPNFRN